MTAALDIAHNEPWMQVHSGKPFHFLSPGIADIDIHDIAHALSMQCRFGGHVRWFYSVAEHSINVSHEVPEEYALAALLHDAAEAYIGDMVSPLKNIMSDFQVVEDRIDAAIKRRFNIPLYDHDQEQAVKRADLALCIHEGRTLLTNQSLVDLWPFTHMPNYALNKEHTLRGLTPEKAKSDFLRRFDQLLIARSKD